MTKKICDIKLLLDHRIISLMDYYFACYMCETVKETDPLIKMSCALVSKAISQGHVCLEIDHLAGHPLKALEHMTMTKSLIFPDKKSWSDALHKSALVAETPDHPLVFESSKRLYLAKYYDFQSRLTRNIVQRIEQPICRDDDQSIQNAVNNCFSGVLKNAPGIELQKKAMTNSLTRLFSIISGGPGTGKTHITHMIISLIQHFFGLSGQSPRIVSLAPTGKAAVKLQNGMTIHRALKYNPEKGSFGHHKNNPFLCDVAIIDEASMIDIALMTRLLEAIPLTARVIMLGDHNQLSSVEAGAVFGDICQADGLSEYQTHLEYNFRSENKGGIDHMAKAVRKGDCHEINRLLDSDATGQICFQKLSEPSLLNDLIKDTVLKGYRSFVCQLDPGLSLEALDQFRVLCAHKYGPYGSIALNMHCKNILRSSVNSDIQDSFFKHAIMIHSNSYLKNLYNGDTGIIFNDQGLSKAVFRQAGQGFVFFKPSELPLYEDAFAMTIHKSQGAEFDSVLLILPPASSFITRQLLYTGLTRAKKQVIIVGNRETILEASNQTIVRHSNIPNLINQQLDQKRYS